MSARQLLLFLPAVCLPLLAAAGCDGSKDSEEEDGNCALAPELCDEPGTTDTDTDDTDTDDTDDTDEPDDSAEPIETGWWEESGDWPDDSYIGDIRGTAGLFIQGSCEIVFELSGEHACDSCGLSWDVTLVLDSSTCEDVVEGPIPGSFEVDGGSVYFQGYYWGRASYGGGALTWATNGYITGAGGGSYYYVGSAAYDDVGGGTGGSGGTVDSGDPPEGSEIDGIFGVYLQELACDYVFDMGGPRASTGDLAWDVELIHNSNTCGTGGTNLSGPFEVSSGSAYFQSYYLGAAYYGGGLVTWATRGYVTGVGGLSYYYTGTAVY